MPLFYQHNINAGAKLAVWHIEESEDFFLQEVVLQKEIHHPHKRLQHLAGRYLLNLLHPGFPLDLIEIGASNKPLLPGNSFHFSISHCGNYAAAIVSVTDSAGVDVELISPKILAIQSKFLSAEEIGLLPAADMTFLTVSWSCKESIYKWYGLGGVDFKTDMVVRKLFVRDDAGSVDCLFTKDGAKELKVQFQLFGHLCLAWVTG